MVLTVNSFNYFLAMFYIISRSLLFRCGVSLFTYGSGVTKADFVRTFERQKRAGKEMGFVKTQMDLDGTMKLAHQTVKTQVKEVVMGHVADRIWELQKDHLEPGEMHPY